MALRFQLPQMSLTMQEGTIIKWVAKEGELLKKNDVLLEIETDKTTAELTAPCTGILVKRMFPEGAVVGVGDVVCVIDDGSADEAAEQAPIAATKAVTAQEITVETPADVRAWGKTVSPLAAKIAAKEGISLEGINGTGPRGVIVKKDVLAVMDQPIQQEETPAPSVTSEAYGAYTDIPFVGVRKKTAENMMRSCMNTAAVTTFVEVDMSKVKQMREFVKATYTAYVVKAVANALGKYPDINSSLVGEHIRLYKDANINVAVSANEKLVTPVVRQANQRSLMEVNAEITALAERAHVGKLELRDFEGGTFTVTNSGVFGSVFFTPIINYPQCAILGMGKAVDTPVVRDGQIVIVPVLKLCLTYDHRLVDGASAVQFLVRVKDGLENPGDLL